MALQDGAREGKDVARLRLRESGAAKQGDQFGFVQCSHRRGRAGAGEKPVADRDCGFVQRASTDQAGDELFVGVW